MKPTDDARYISAVSDRSHTCVIPRSHQGRAVHLSTAHESSIKVVVTPRARVHPISWKREYLRRVSHFLCYLCLCFCQSTAPGTLGDFSDMRDSKACWLLVVLAVSAASAVHGSLMAIDLGSEFLKVCLVKPGRTPISMVVNEMSKRKSPALVGLVDEDRVVGEEAFSLAIRYPNKIYSQLRNLLGRSAQDAEVQQLIQHSMLPYKVVDHPLRGTCAVQANETASYLVEELVVSTTAKRMLDLNNRVQAPSGHATCLTVECLSTGSVKALRRKFLCCIFLGSSGSSVLRFLGFSVTLYEGHTQAPTP